MRTIKFRGKSLHTGEWHYGDLVQPSDNAVFIQERGTAGFFSDPETVGQLTGQLDKNKKEIWEGDIVRVGILSPNYIGSHPEPYYVDTVCIYKEGAFLYKRISPFDKKKLSRNWTYKPMHRYDIYSTEVIGNIHDNPELMEGGAE